LNIRVPITEFYCDRPAGLPGFSLPGAKAKAPPKRGLLSIGLCGYGDLKHASCGAPKGSEERWDIGAAVTASTMEARMN
jgi:hypothetical protein